MCYMYGEACFDKKILINGLNMGLLLWAWVEKAVHRVEIHWFSGKEKVLATAISKKRHSDLCLGHNRTHHYWFS